MKGPEDRPVSGADSTEAFSGAFLRGRKAASRPPAPPVAPREEPQANGVIPPGAQQPGDNVLPFKRRRGPRPSRRKRHPLLRLLRPLGAALLIVGLPTALGAWMLLGPQFAFAGVEVETGPRVSQRWVERVLAPHLGDGLLMLSLDDAERRIASHPWVDRLDLRKRLPGTLQVRVTERRAAALLREGGELLLLDEQGRPIAPFDPRWSGMDLPLVSRADPGITNLRCALDLIEEIRAVRPDWVAGLSEIEVLSEQDFQVFTESLPFPLLVKAGSFESKARRLETLLPQIIERYGSVAALDLRFSRRIILQPSGRRQQSG